MAILGRLQGKNLAIHRPPPWFHQGHPNLELAVFEQLAEAPHSFIYPQMLVGQEYRDEMIRTFEHIWNWPVPEEPLAGLSGAERQARIDALCRAEVERTLRAVRENIQQKLDDKTARARLQPQEAP
jgi:hypothetical protein